MAAPAEGWAAAYRATAALEWKSCHHSGMRYCRVPHGPNDSDRTRTRRNPDGSEPLLAERDRTLGHLRHRSLNFGAVQPRWPYSAAYIKSIGSPS